MYQLESRADTVLTLTTPATAAGTAYLKFALGPNSDTILERSFATSPLKVFATRGGGIACWAYAATLGGGLVGGDAIHMNIEVGAGARALLTTQASTKVYRSARSSTQRVSATVGDGAFLAVVPDPIVCYAAADFAQTQHYELHTGASMLLVDWITSGRHASGERWAFSRYQSRLTIKRDGLPVLHDAVLLEADLDSILERMRRFDVLLTAVLSGPLVSDVAAAIFDHAARQPAGRNADLILSASRIADGVLLRMAGGSVERVGGALRDSLRDLYPLLGDDPWSRKW